MTFDPLSAAFELGKTAIEKIWPDPTKRAEEMRKLEELRQNGDLAQLNAHVQLMLAQINANTEQAKHKSVFVAGARPAIMWICGIGLAFTSIVHPLLVWVWAFAMLQGTPPEPMDMSYLMPILMGVLGLGGMRSWDKKNGVQTDRIKE